MSEGILETPLDEEQNKVVYEEGSIFCVAGPGSGKTRVLTERARRIFNSGESLICLTFTRAAASEMGERVTGLPTCTIHSYCCGRIGWNEKWGYSGLLYRFLEDDTIDKYDHVLVDETQDLNDLEMDVVLSMVGKSLFAVGDPYQSIYGFQGALGPKISSLFSSLGCKKMELKNNYRSSPEIISRLNGIYNRGLVSKGIRETGLTCILCRTNEDVFSISNFLEDSNIPHRVRLSAAQSNSREYDVISPSSLRLNTIHQSKGLEYDNVLLFNWFPNNMDEEMRVYYVSISRASKSFLEVDNLHDLKEILNG